MWQAVDVSRNADTPPTTRVVGAPGRSNRSGSASHTVPAWTAIGILCIAAGCMLMPVPNGATLGLAPADEGDGSEALLAVDESATSLADVAGPPGGRPEPRTIPVDLIVLGFAAAGAGDIDGIERELWAITDEQAVDHRVRCRLAANGLRAGLVPGPLPEWLDKQIASLVVTPDGAPDTGSGLPAVRRTLRLLPGRESRLIARTALDDLVVFESRDDGLSGRTFQAATTTIDLRAWPAADGQVRLRAIPTIRHGPQRRDWVGDDGVFRLEAGQSACLFEELAVDLRVPEGMMLLVGCGSPVASGSVGDAIFNDSMRPRSHEDASQGPSLAGRSAGGSRKAFLIKPLSRAIDPMFDDLSVE